jgi:uncharacterized protein (TIGR02246 family)
MIDQEAAIRELIAGYALALDGGDVDGCVRLFTADAVYLVYGRSFAGHDGIAEMFRKAPRGLHRSIANRRPRRHRHGTLAGAFRESRRPAPAARAVRRRTGSRPDR